MRHVTRATALLEAAEGDIDRATRSIAMAQAAFGTGENRWGQARTALVAGEIHRRARRRSDARHAFQEAHRLFTALGAALWAAEADDQLTRMRAARDEIRGLTPTQAQVAELAVEGLTNRQIGDRLFMSVHTVEAHLSAAYRTLGIASRRELRDAVRDPGVGVRDSVAEPGTDS
jgi:DNA-binding NarL/FixJ family response regulator